MEWLQDKFNKIVAYTAANPKKAVIGFLVLIMVVWVAACTPPKVVQREGQPVPVIAPQAKEQCKAQPWLDWCH